MLSISFVSILVLAGALLTLGLITIITSRRTANLIFAFVCFALTGWTITNYYADADHLHSLLWTRLTFISIVMVISGVVIFANRFPQKTIESKWFDWITVVAGLGMAAICNTPVIVKNIQYIGGTSNVVPGQAYSLFFIFFLTGFILTVVTFVRSLRRLKGIDQTRTRFVVVGITLMAIFGATTNLFLPYILGQNDFARYGPFSTLFFTGLTTYAVAKHQLFDIRRVVARSLAYFLLLATIIIVYVGLAFGLSRLLLNGGQAGFQVQTSIYYGFLSVILAISFQPLRTLFEHFTDKIFYRDRYDVGRLLDDISRILASEIDIDRMLSRSLETLCTELHLKFGQMIIFNQDRVYRVGHYGTLPRRLLVAPELRRLGRHIVVADDLTSGERKRLLNEHDIRVSLGLETGEEFIGYLLLGDKLSGDSYTKTEVELLETISKELAVGIANAKSYAEIQAFNLTLQDRINHATGRLRVANRHLKELDKTKDEFISMASHQLRTPLTTIKGYLSMMTEGDAGKLSSTQREFVGYAFDASERMVNLISDLLNVSRLQAGRFLIQTKPTDVNLMVADEVRQLQQHAINKGLKLTYVGPKDEVPLVDLDEGKTRQVIMNFIDNAIYYTKQGGVTVKLTRHNDDMRLEVSDTGIGVPEASKKKLFSKFYRAENAQGVRPDGTGLGLYLARRVIADQNGTIIFRSTEGHGSTFGFELPIKRASGKA